MVRADSTASRAAEPVADPGAEPAAPPSDFSGQVRRNFGRGAGRYEREARLQRAVAWRLARHCRDLAIPTGPCADLGAGTGLLAGALEQLRPDLRLLRVDNCPQLLAQDAATAPHLRWDLNGGLPPGLEGSALLVSSFALQWLEQPERQLEHWGGQLHAGGWLALAVPTAASFSQWRAAATAAAVPFTGLDLPEAERLERAAGRHLELRLCRRLRFSRPAPSAMGFLGQIKAIGAQASRGPRLGPAQLRRLEAAWPNAAGRRLEWEVLLLLGRRPGAA